MVICAECGEEISAQRLAAVPHARLCVQCQAQEVTLPIVSPNVMAYSSDGNPWPDSVGGRRD